MHTTSNLELISKSDLSRLGVGVSDARTNGTNQLPYLAFALSDLPTKFDATELTTYPQPVIGIGSKDDPRASYCDLVIRPDQNVTRVLANIYQHPQTAAVLVQTLRATDQVSKRLGLKIESLAYATLQSGSEYQQWLAVHKPTSTTPVTDDGPPVNLGNVDGNLLIELNRASRRNAISVEMRDALCEAFELAHLDPEISHVGIKGNGACFSIGGDLEEFGQTPDPVTGHLVRSMRLPAAHLLNMTKTTHVTAYLHSACIGAGIELPAFANTLVAAPNTFFQLPEISFGLIPGAGGCVSLVHRIGRHATAELCLSGKKINATKALALGLIDRIDQDTLAAS